MQTGTPAAAILTSVLLAVASASTAAAIDAGTPIALDIPATDLPTALRLLAQQADIQLVYVPDTAADSSARTPPLKGEYTTEQALRIVLAHTRLTYAANDRDTIVVKRIEAQTSDARGAPRDPGGVEEVVVSARRRTESEKDVPLSLVVKTGEELTRTRIDDLSQLERLVPGMIYGGLSVTPYPAISLRGVGSLFASSGTDASVGMAIDGAVVPQSSALSSDFSDIARIEVLRGPQGTLFGKNSSAGLVSIVTKDPSESWTGNVDVGTGSYDEIKLKGTVSGPLAGEALLGRLALYSDKRDGYIYNIGMGRKVMDDDQKGARATFVYRPADATRLRLSIFDVVRKNDWAHSVMPARSVGPSSSAIDRQLLGTIAGPQNDALWTTGDGFIDYLTQTWGTTLQWDQTLGNHSLTSISSYLDWYWRQYWNNLTDGPAPFTIRQLNDATTWTEQWSEELRLSSPLDRRVDYVAGLYYYHLLSGAANEHRFVPAANRLQYNSSRSEVTTDNYAIFSEANFHATDTLTLTTGARWTHEENGYYALGRPLPAGAEAFLLSNASGIEIRDSALTEKVSWRLGARWEPSGNRMYYVTASRGFKGVGFNPIPSTSRSEKVRPEVATTYEVGAKASWLQNRLSTNVALYHSIFVDAQARAFATTVNGSGTAVTFSLTNAGKLRTQGAEFELVALPLDNLTVSLIGAYVDGVFVDYSGAQCYAGQLQFGTGCVATAQLPAGSQDLSGARLPFAPRWSGTLSADYQQTFARLPFNGFVRADYSWRGDVQYSFSDAPNGIEPAYGLLGATLGVRRKDDRYSISVYGKNLTDKFHVSGLGILSPGGLGTTTQMIAPDYQRVWGAAFNYNF